MIIKDKLFQIEPKENQIIINIINLIIDVFDFYLPKPHYLDIYLSSIELQYFYGIDHWKIMEVDNKINLLSLIEFITSYYENKIRYKEKNFATENEIQKNLMKFKKIVEGFDMQKYDFCSRIYEMFEIIEENKDKAE
ncbi:uncharacterized protein VNE69_08043 [Vairimorpha necatrix]|uniref:Uncharacterized protein n=1 Tax=Vairimorpha necatrix TaxID=6039 RepID=A0AAX4JE73_9MICR